MADKTLLELASENPNGWGDKPPALAEPRIVYDEYGRPYDAQGKRIYDMRSADEAPSLGESLLNIAESPAKMLVGAVTEPISALQRLAENSVDENGNIAIPNPENPQNQQDVLTGLLSLYGGNALNPARMAEGAAARAAPEITPRALGYGDDTARWFLEGDKPVYTTGGTNPGATVARQYGPELAAQMDAYPYIDSVMPVNTVGGQPYLHRTWYKPGEEARAQQLSELAASTNTKAKDHHRRIGLALGYPDEAVEKFVLGRNDLLSDTGKPSLMGSAIAAESAPQRMYHGTTADFSTFKPSESGSFGPGVYFSSSPEYASQFAFEQNGSRVFPVDVQGPLASMEDYFSLLHANGRNQAKTLKMLEDQGYTGIITSGERPSQNVTSVFKPGSVRSATTGETLFSDTGRPSIFGATLAGVEKNGNEWVSKSPYGRIDARFDPDANAVRIQSSSVTPGHQGKGRGMELYRALIDDAHGNGYPVISDSSVSPSAQRVYESLDRQGYDLNVNPEASLLVGHRVPGTAGTGGQGGVFSLPPPNYTGPAVFSDTGKPSIAGAAIAGAEGNTPVRAYHATNADFGKFDPAYTNEVGFHFGDKGTANNRAYIRSNGNPIKFFGYKNIPVDMDIRNPAELSRDVAPSFAGKPLATQLVQDGIAPPSLLDDLAQKSPAEQNATVRNWLIDNGYDAVKYPNQFEGQGKPSYMALGTGNVKHAKTGQVLYSGAPPVVQAASDDEQPLSLADLALIAGR